MNIGKQPAAGLTRFSLNNFMVSICSFCGLFLYFSIIDSSSICLFLVASQHEDNCLILGYLIPKAVYKYREYKTGTTKFHVAEDIKNNNKKDLI